MATLGLGKYSEQSLDDGQLAMPGLNHYGYMIGACFQSGSVFAAAVEKGRVFAVANQSGVTSQAGLSATTPVLTLYNPPGSGVTGRLWFAGASMLVANAAAATVWLAAGTNAIAANTTGTITTAHRCLKMGGITPASQGNRVVALTAATLGSVPVAIDVLGAGLTGAITVLTPSIPALAKCYYGALLIQPGTHLSIQTSTASGVNGLVCSYVWEEHGLIS
jgi:hypothetical protein